MRRTMFLVTTTLLFTSTLFAQDGARDFRKILSSKGYFGAAAGVSWPYAGGFLVMDKSGNLTFIDLPPEIQRPNSRDETILFPAVNQTKSISLKSILTGFLTILGGNPGLGFGHTSSMNFLQLKAEGKRITYDEANSLVSSKTTQQIVKWQSTGHRVFIVAVALSTRNISVTTDSKWNIDATFNGKVASDCGSMPNNSNKGSTDESNSDKNSDSSPGSGTKPDGKPATTGQGNQNKTTTQALQNQNQGQTPKQDTTEQAGTTNANSPGGELHFCKGSKNILTMTTENPLIFALGAYEVVTSKGQQLLEPVMSVPKNSGPFNITHDDPTQVSEGQMTKPKVRVASEASPSWGRQPWPSAAKP